jgi:hypothetical protein
MIRRIALAAGIVLGVVSSASGAAAENGEDLHVVIQALQERVEAQDRRIADLEAKLAATQDDPSDQKEQIRQVIREMKADKKEGLGGPSWLENLTFFGDLRLRYEAGYYDWDKSDGHAKKDLHRARFRLRIGATKTWLDDQLEVTFRLASGSDEHPTSTNQTFDDDFQKKKVWIDLAYARYSPASVKGLKIIGGKMKTPWTTNEIFLDTDVNPEGFWAEYVVPKLGVVQPFVGAGFFVLQESADGTDATLGVYQVGTKVDIATGVRYTVVGFYHDYDAYSQSGALARGNDSPLMMVPEFRIVGVSNAVEFPLCGRPATVFADFAHNCGEGDATDEYHGQDNAFATGIQLGQNKKKGDWSLKYRYAYIEADSLPGYFVDADFGYANRQGHVFGGTYNLMDDLTVGATVRITQPIFSPTTNSGSSADENITTTFQVDLMWKF